MYIFSPGVSEHLAPLKEHARRFGWPLHVPLYRHIRLRLVESEGVAGLFRRREATKSGGMATRGSAAVSFA